MVQICNFVEYEGANVDTNLATHPYTETTE